MTVPRQFAEANAKATKGGRPSRQAWEERKSLIAETWPLVSSPGQAIVQNETALARLLMNIVAAGQNLNVSQGDRRIIVDPEAGYEDLKTMGGANYSTLPFCEAFRELARDRSTGRLHSRSEIAAKVSISRARVHRLLTRAEPPTMADLADIATAYGKPASYFAEYRSRFVAQHLASVLDRNPDMSHEVYRKIVKEA